MKLEAMYGYMKNVENVYTFVNTFYKTFDNLNL